MRERIRQPLRYIINGLVATGVHFSVFMFNIHVLKISLAGVANLSAACVGIFIAFLGNRHFVFPNHSKIAPQALKFFAMYVFLALMHGAVLTVWTDWRGFNYQTGFFIAIMLQVIGGYLGNKYWVFRT